MNDPTIDENELLRRAAGRDRAAMDALIRRYVDLVWGVALRQTGGDAQLAADVSQAVFLVFIRKISSIRRASALPGWFHHTTRFAVRTARRAARRREHYEKRAAKGELTMNSTIYKQAGLELVDEAIASLGSTDRDLVLMRYIQQREVGEVAQAVGISEPAARKRLTRAIEKMRRFFAGRGAAMSVGGVTGVLGMAAGQSAPAAVVEAAVAAGTGAVVSSAAMSVVKGMVNAMMWIKVKVAAVIGMAIITVAGGAAILQVQQGGPAAASPPASAPAAVVALPAMGPEEALAQLNIEYALANNEILRLIRAPFSQARTVWAEAEYPYARGADRIRSLGFFWRDGKLQRKYMSYADMSLEALLTLPLEIAWFRVDGLNGVKWAPVHADVVVRDSASPQEKLDALAKVIKDVTGESVRFVKATQSRLCIILVRSRFEGPGTIDAYDTDRFARALDAPTIRAGDDLDDPMFVYRFGERFFPPNASLDRADADYEKRLREVVAQIQEQNGGEWRVERRELEIFVLEHVKTSHPAREAVEAFLAAAARNDAQAAQAVSFENRPLQLDDTAEMLALNGGAIEIDFVEADADNAIVVSKPIKDDRGRAGVMLVTLRQANGRWSIVDIDFETPQSLPQELARFTRQHLNAVRVSDSPATQPSRGP